MTWLQTRCGPPPTERSCWRTAPQLRSIPFWALGSKPSLASCSPVRTERTVPATPNQERRNHADQASCSVHGGTSISMPMRATQVATSHFAPQVPCRAAETIRPRCSPRDAAAAGCCHQPQTREPIERRRQALPIRTGRRRTEQIARAWHIGAADVVGACPQPVLQLSALRSMALAVLAAELRCLPMHRASRDCLSFRSAPGTQSANNLCHTSWARSAHSASASRSH